MGDLQERITIEQPLDAVFSFLANPENRTEMYVNVVEVVKKEDTVYEEIRQFSNRKVSSTLKLLEVVENKKVVLKSESNGLNVQYVYKVSSIDDGSTRVTFEGTVQTDTIRTKLLRPLLVKMLKREEGDHLTSVKKVMES
ncbi:SRPBCC family protein [Evansella sp. AB-rgal1]|uniref:SRPBCC family protein n=1 Tax=Evansella sp. AB-rgal1 TaxID=3242696 RepID=UPI00359CC567